MRPIERDVDPTTVVAFLASRAAYQARTAAWGRPMRCRTNVCDGDGSCVHCGADQGESCRPARPGAL